MPTTPFPRVALAGALCVLLPFPFTGCSDGGGVAEPDPTDPTDPPPATPTIAIALSATSLDLVQGAGGSVTVTVTRGGGFTGPVGLYLEGAPSGVTGTFDPASVPGPSTSSILRLDAAASAPAGQHALTVRARGEGVEDATRAVTLRVEEGIAMSGEWAVFDAANSDLPQNWVRTVSIDDAGIRWVGTRNGLVTIDGENWTVYTTTNSDLPGPNVFRVAAGVGGTVWVETGVVEDGLCCVGNGVARFDGTTWTHFTRANSGLRDDLARGTAVDRGERVWRIPVLFPGLDVFDGGSWTSYESPDITVGLGLSTDEDGNVWLVGLGSAGAVILSNDGGAWVADQAASAGLTDLLFGTQVSAMAVARNGDIWLGTPTSGVLHHDGSGWNEYDADNSGLPSNLVTSLAIDEEGGVWIGAIGGLAHFDGQTWVVYTMENSDLPSPFVTTVAIDRNGNKWVGTGPGFPRGLAVFNENGITW